MQLPRALARFNKHVTNRIQMLWAPRLPGFGVIEHVGRRSGRRYRTPVNMYEVPDGFAVLLVYGTGTDWLRNVVAAGGATLVRRRRQHPVEAPRILTGPDARALLPAPIRLVSRLTRTDGVLHLHAAAAPTTGTAP